MSLYQEIIEKILQEVDPDIRELMLKESKACGEKDRLYKGYELLSDAGNVILNWQALRDRKNG